MALLAGLLALGTATPTFAANLTKPGHKPKAPPPPPPVATAPPAPAPAPPTSAPAPNPAPATATQPATVTRPAPAATPASDATPPATPAPTPTAASTPKPAPKATAPLPANPAPPQRAQSRPRALDGPAGFELAAAVVGLLLFTAAGWLLLRGKGPRAATQGTPDGSTGRESATAFDAQPALIPSLEPHFATVPEAPPPAVGRGLTEPIVENTHHGSGAPAAAALRRFISAWSGASVGADSETYPGMALLRRYSEEVVGAPPLWVAPIEIPRSYSMDHFVWVEESPYQVPAPGDVVVWGRCSEDASDGGRAAIFVRGDATGFDAFTVEGAAADVQHYADYRWVLGWLRPITGVPPAS